MRRGAVFKAGESAEFTIFAGRSTAWDNSQNNEVMARAMINKVFFRI
jgi:hypothetical protein